MKRMMMWSFLACACIFGGCKKAEIIYPVPFIESDFTVPPAQFSTPTIGLSVNRLNRVVYVGEEFEVKVALYNMPESLFAATCDINLPANIRIERIITNPDYIGSPENTIGLEVTAGQSASVGMSYRRATTPHVGSAGVLVKIICKALTVGDHLQVGVTNENFRITRRNVAISPTSMNVNMNVGASGVEVTVSDEFAR